MPLEYKGAACDANLRFSKVLSSVKERLLDHTFACEDHHPYEVPPCKSLRCHLCWELWWGARFHIFRHIVPRVMEALRTPLRVLNGLYEGDIEDVDQCAHKA